MEKLVSNPGLQIIAINIFAKLDPKSRQNSRLVSKSWRAIIDQTSKLQNRKMFENVESESLNQLVGKWPEWRKVLIYFYHTRSKEDVSKFAQILQAYFSKNFQFSNYDPLLAAAKSNEWENVEFLLPSIKNPDVISMGEILELAFKYRNGNVTEKNQLYSMIAKICE